MDLGEGVPGAAIGGEELGGFEEVGERAARLDDGGGAAPELDDGGEALDRVALLGGVGEEGEDLAPGLVGEDEGGFGRVRDGDLRGGTGGGETRAGGGKDAAVRAAWSLDWAVARPPKASTPRLW